MEEATVSDLKTLLQRLEQSVGLVKDAIDQMASASENSTSAMRRMAPPFPQK